MEDSASEGSVEVSTVAAKAVAVKLVKDCLVSGMVRLGFGTDGGLDGVVEEEVVVKRAEGEKMDAIGVDLFWIGGCGGLIVCLCVYYPGLYLNEILLIHLMGRVLLS